MPKGVGNLERVHVLPRVISVLPQSDDWPDSDIEEEVLLGPELTSDMALQEDEQMANTDKRKKIRKPASFGPSSLGVLECLPVSASWVSLRRNVRASVRSSLGRCANQKEV